MAQSAVRGSTKFLIGLEHVLPRQIAGWSFSLDLRRLFAHVKD